MSGFSAARTIKKEDSAPVGDANDGYKSDEDALADARGHQAARKYDSSIECYGIYFRRIGYHTTIKPGSRTAKSLLIALHGISTAYYEFAITEFDSGKTVDHAAIKQHIEDALYWAMLYNNRQKKQHKHFDLLQIESLFERLESKSAVVPEQEKDYKPITPATSLDTGMPIDAVIDRKLRELFEVLAEVGVPESERPAFIAERAVALLSRAAGLPGSGAREDAAPQRHVNAGVGGMAQAARDAKASVTASTSSRAKPLPAPPPGHQWPTETYSGSPEAKRGGAGIVAYLERVWLPLFQTASGVISLPLLRTIDPSAAFGINNYTRNGRSLPPHLDIPTKKTVNDRLLSQGYHMILNDARLARVVANRIRDGRKIPGF